MSESTKVLKERNKIQWWEYISGHRSQPETVPNGQKMETLNNNKVVLDYNLKCKVNVCEFVLIMKERERGKRKKEEKKKESYISWTEEFQVVYVAYPTPSERWSIILYSLIVDYTLWLLSKEYSMEKENKNHYTVQRNLIQMPQSGSRIIKVNINYIKSYVSLMYSMYPWFDGIQMTLPLWFPPPIQKIC